MPRDDDRGQLQARLRNPVADTLFKSMSKEDPTRGIQARGGGAAWSARTSWSTPGPTVTTNPTQTRMNTTLATPPSPNASSRWPYLCNKSYLRKHTCWGASHRHNRLT